VWILSLSQIAQESRKSNHNNKNNIERNKKKE